MVSAVTSSILIFKSIQKNVIIVVQAETLGPGGMCVLSSLIAYFFTDSFFDDGLCLPRQVSFFPRLTHGIFIRFLVLIISALVFLDFRYLGTSKWIPTTFRRQRKKYLIRSAEDGSIVLMRVSQWESSNFLSDQWESSKTNMADF